MEAKASALDSRRSYDTGDSLTHQFCKACWEKHTARGWKLVALCGASGHPRGDGSRPYVPGEACMVCDDLLELPCARCGADMRSGA